MRELLNQIAGFATVGLVATGVHALAYALLGGMAFISPLLANFLAFLLAFVFSYVGHFKITFAKEMEGRSLHRSFGIQLRFFLVALLGLGLNSLAVWLTTDVLELHYLLAILPMVFLVPLATFGLSRVWAFK